ncbi:MAG TPA: HDOD domain-containing protein [bacterium]|nr:HDOD domain-containing protein [bacterium]
MAATYSKEEVYKLVRERIGRRVRSGELNVPVLPHIAQEILALTNSPNSSARDFVALIEKDQQLSSRLLKIANSPVYAGLVAVTSIQTAVVTVGMNTLRDLVFGVAMGERIFRSKMFGDLVRQMWEHSLTVAYIAKEIATLKRVDAEYAFLCGLMHDVGKPLVLETLEEIVKRTEGKLRPEAELVNGLLQDYHAAVGGLMARAWNFPATLHDVIRYHHEYDEAGPAQRMALITYTANQFAHAMGFGSYMDEEPMEIAGDHALTALNLSDEKVDELLERLPKATRELITSFSG